MNPNQYWNRQNRKKVGWERKYIRDFFLALRKQIDPLMADFDSYQVPQDVERAVRFTDKEIKPVFRDLYRRVVPDFIRDQADELSRQRRSKAFSRKQETEIDPEMIELLWLQQLDPWLAENVAAVIVTIIGTQRARAIQIIQEITDEAIAEGLSIPDTMSKLERQIPQQWRKQKWISERIARTEVLKAANEGNFRMAKASGVANYKRWITRIDGRERAEHRAANRQSRPIDVPFDVGGEQLMKPGEGSGANAINCRCAVIYSDLPFED